MPRPRLLLTQRIFPDLVEEARRAVDVDYRDEDGPMATADLVRRLAGSQGLVCMSTERVGPDVLSVPGLRVVSNIAVGYNNVDVAAATERGVVVTNTPGVLDETTADLAFALILATARRVVESDGWLRDGRWKSWTFFDWLGGDVHGKTLGVVGFGRIGQAVARRGRGFGMTILYTQRRKASASVEAALGARYVDKGTLLAESDFVTLHCPLTPETTHYIDAAALARMKPTAFLVNTARGPVVDEKALVAALEAKRIAGAGIDVFEKEPAVDPGLVGMPNVALTPHVGSATVDTRRKMASLALENCIAVLTGKRPPTPVNPEVLGR